MPTYSYACTECDNRFDVVQAFSDDALTACPKCDGRLRKLFGKVGVVFKGSGFYRTDSRESAKSTSTSSSSVVQRVRPAARSRRTRRLVRLVGEVELQLVQFELGSSSSSTSSSATRRRSLQLTRVIHRPGVTRAPITRASAA